MSPGSPQLPDTGGSGLGGDEPAVPVTAGPGALGGVLQLLAAALLLGGVMTGLVGDRGGVVLAVPVVLALAGLGLRDLLLRPVLLADAEAVEVVHGLRRLRAPWSEVERMRVVTDRRAPLLELDLGEVLVVLGRRRLRRSPEAVLAELAALRAPPYPGVRQR